MSNIAAIHVLKTQCRLTDGDYRALLQQLTGKASCKDMRPAELALVRTHLGKLAERLGVAMQPASKFAQAQKAACPQERYLHVLWRQLSEAGKVNEPGVRGLNAWCQRQCGVSSPRFANAAQLATMVDAAKMWLGRR